MLCTVHVRFSSLDKIEKIVLHKSKNLIQVYYYTRVLGLPIMTPLYMLASSVSKSDEEFSPDSAIT